MDRLSDESPIKDGFQQLFFRTAMGEQQNKFILLQRPTDATMPNTTIIVNICLILVMYSKISKVFKIFSDEKRDRLKKL